MSGSSYGPRFRLFRIENNVITYDRVIEYEKLDISTEYIISGTEARITVRNDHSFAIPLKLHVKLTGSPPFTATKGTILNNLTSGDVWIDYNAPTGQNLIQIF